MIASDSYFVIYGIGPLSVDGRSSPLANRWNFLCATSWYYTVLASQCAVAIQFLYRYCALCRGYLFSNRCYALSLAVVAVGAGLVLPVWWAGEFNDPAHYPLADALFFSGVPKRELASFTRPHDPYNVVICLQIFACLLAVDAVIVVCSVRVWLHLRRAVSDLGGDSRSRLASTQINVVLIAQAVIPLVLEVLPNFLTTLSILTNLRTGSAVAMVSSLLNWAPVASALSVIVIVRPYRRAVWSLMGLEKARASRCMAMTETQAVITPIDALAH